MYRLFILAAIVLLVIAFILSLGPSTLFTKGAETYFIAGVLCMAIDIATEYRVGSAGRRAP